MLIAHVRFTPRGVVALVFSILSAFLGLAAITWYVLLAYVSLASNPFADFRYRYGMGDLGSGELTAVRRRIAEGGIK